MADVKRTVEIVFGGKNEVSRMIDDIGRDFSNIGSKFTNVTGPLDVITDKVLMAEAAFLTLAGAGMAYAIKQSSEFNKSFALISTSITATGGDLSKYRDDVLAYSTTSVRSLTDINAALYTAAQAGVKYSESLDFMRKAEQLSVANNASLNTTVDLLTGTMNAYGFSVRDVGRLNDVFFQSTLIGKQTIDELGQSMGQVVGIAANSGVGFAELNAAIATLTAKGMNTADAITAVKNVITTIISPSKDAASAAANLGLKFSLTELSAKGFSTMLTEIMSKTGGSKEKMVDLFNEVRAMNGVLQLTGDGMKFFNSALDQTTHSAGASEAAYQKMVATFSNQSQMALNSAQTMLIEVGTRLEPIAAKMVGSFAGVFAGLRTGLAQGAFDPLFTYLEKFGKDMADKIAIIGKNLPEALRGIDFSGLIKSFEGLGGAVVEAFQAIFGNIDLTTPEGLHAAIQKIIDGLAALTNITKGVIDGMNPLFELIGTGIDKFSKLDESSAGLIGTLLGVAKSINIVAEYSAVLTSVLTILTGKALLDVTLAVAKLGVTAASAVPGLVGFLGTVGTLGAGATFGVAGAATAISIMTGTLLAQIPAVQQGSQALLGLIDVNKDFFGAQGRTKEEVELVNKKFDEAVLKHKALAGGTGQTTDATTSLDKALQGLDFARGQKAFDDLNASLKKIRDDLAEAERIKDWNITVRVLADGSTIEKAYSAIIKTFPDGKVLLTNVGVEYDEANLKKVQKKIDEAIPKDKLVEIQAKLDEAKIKAQSDIIQKAVEWKAKLDIAQVEAETARLKTLFDSINVSITSTGTTLASLVGSVSASVGTGTTSFIQGQIEAEARRRDEALKLQKDLIEAEVAVLRKRAEALAKGEGIIKIESSNLAPHLEAFMLEILKAIQVKANSEGMKFLVSA